MRRIATGLALTALLSLGGAAAAQTPPQLSMCDGKDKAPACDAIRGDRAEHWLPQSRSEVFSTHGMVATSTPLAAQAGMRILQQGGNAVDAAVATAAALNITEPMMVGMGADMFAIVYVAKEHKLYALDASGTAPTGATPEHLAELGYVANPKNGGPTSGMPVHGILAVTTPGALWGWDALLKRFGTMGFDKVLEPARDYAENGYPVSERTAHDWEMPKALPLRHCCDALDPDSIKAWYIDGKPPVAGQVFRNPDLAKTFRILQTQGADAFYKGEIAHAIVAKSQALGGSMTLQDLANYHGNWVELAHTTYHGHDVYELPAPSQDWAALEMVNILEACVPQWAPGQTLASLGPRNPEFWHLMVEAKKLAFTDLMAFNADPAFVKVPVDRLTSKAYARTLCAKANGATAAVVGPPPASAPKGGTDTVVLTTADSQGNMVAWVNSNASAFGSGLTVPGYGFILHNRGVLFSLDRSSPDVIAPGKRPFNTLSAGFVMDGDRPLMTLLLMGGDMQAQGHAQILVDLFDLGANLQQAGDMARFRHTQATNRLTLEPSLDAMVGQALAAKGHVMTPPESDGMGGFQSIMLQPGSTPEHPVWRGASDHRKDGEAVGW